MAERFLGEEYTPEARRNDTGVPADTIRRIAAELAEAAFEQAIELDIPWTDWTGRRHDKMIGRPVCDARHARHLGPFERLPDLPHAPHPADPARHDRLPGGFRYKPPFPKPDPAAAETVRQARHRSSPTRRWAARRSASRSGPEDLLVDADGKPQRIDKAYSWDAPLAAHGLMHMVITNAANRDPYPVDVLFMYMANMSWNSSMNIPAVLQHLTAKDEATGEYKIPKIIYSDAYFSEMVALCRSHPARHDLSRALGLHLAARPADLGSRRAGRCDPPAGRRARPRRAPLPGRAARSRRAARTAGLRRRGRRAEISRRLCRLHRQSRTRARRRPAGRLARRRTATSSARASPTRTSSSATSRTAASMPTNWRPTSATSSTPTRTISIGPPRSASWAHGDPDRLPALPRAAAEVPPRRRGPRRRRSRPTATASASSAYFDPLPFWYAPFEGTMLDEDELPAARHHPAADAHVSFVGLAERLAAPDPRLQPPPYAHAPRATALGVETTTGSGSRAPSAASRRRCS